MRVLISKRAQRELERIDEQWREVADHTEVFADEFLEWVEKLGRVPGIGQPWPTEKRPELKRVQLRKSEVHLYFTRDDETVRIMAAWWSRRKRPPKL